MYFLPLSHHENMAQSKDGASMMIGGLSVSFVVFAVLVALPLKALQTKAYSLALLSALLAYSTRITQLLARSVDMHSVSLRNLDSLRSKALAAAQQLSGSNDLQLAAVSALLLVTSRSPNPLHLGMHTPIAYQALMFLHARAGSTRAWSLLRLDRFFQFANEKYLEAFGLATQLEIVTALTSLAEIFFPKQSLLGPVRPVLLVQWLRLRNQCGSDQVLKLRYPQRQRPSTLHAMFWNTLYQRLQPYYSKVPYAERVIKAASDWFHGRRAR